MYPLRIVGHSDSGKTTLVDRLVPELSGRVATVKHLGTTVDLDEPGTDTFRHRAAGAGTTYGIEDDGSWFATGGERGLHHTLRELAPDYEYALLEGYSGEPTLPAIVLAGRDHQGEAIATAPSGGAVDLDRVISRLESEPELETTASLLAAAKRAAPVDMSAATATLSVALPDEVPPERIRTAEPDSSEDIRRGLYAVRLHADPYLTDRRAHAAAVATDARTALAGIDDRLAALDVELTD